MGCPAIIKPQCHKISCSFLGLDESSRIEQQPRRFRLQVSYSRERASEDCKYCKYPRTTRTGLKLTVPPGRPCSSPVLILSSSISLALLSLSPSLLLSLVSQLRQVSTHRPLSALLWPGTSRPVVLPFFSTCLFVPFWALVVTSASLSLPSSIQAVSCQFRSFGFLTPLRFQPEALHR